MSYQQEIVGGYFLLARPVHLFDLIIRHTDIALSCHKLPVHHSYANQS